MINVVNADEPKSYSVKISREATIVSKADLNKSLAIKDFNNISDNSWNRMRIDLNLKDNIHSLNRIIKHRKSYSNKIIIKTNEYGVYISVKKKLELVLKQLFESDKLGNVNNNIITIKLCGDGCNVTKNISFFNFSMSVINDKNNCKKSRGHYIIGIFEVSENYENLKVALKQIVKQVNKIKKIKFTSALGEEIFYTINFKIATDLKATAELMGINNATSQFPCPFCKIHFCASRSVQNPNQNEANRRRFKEQINLEWDLGNISELNSPLEMGSENETETNDETESESETENEEELEYNTESSENNISYRTLAEAKQVFNSNNLLIRKGKILLFFSKI